MPGNGDITGGSCQVRFKVHNNPQHVEQDPAVPAGQPVTVFVTTPDGKTTPYTLRSNAEKISFHWLP